MNRHLSRTIAMQILFEQDFRPEADLSETIERNIDAYREDADAEYIRFMVQGAIEHEQELDQAIAQVAPEWPVDQIAGVDKAILRLAIFEILYNEDVPPKVAINEAVELGKTFGSDSTSRFVNGVLGTVYRTSDRYNPEEDQEPTKEVVREEGQLPSHDEQDIEQPTQD